MRADRLDPGAESRGRKLRLLFVEAFKTTGGQERFALSLSQGMEDRGFEVAILTEPGTAMEAQLAGLKWRVFRCPRSGARGWWRGLQASSRSFGPDVIVLNGDRAGYWGRLFNAFRHSPARVVWIAHLHLDDIVRGWTRTKFAAYRAAYRATLPFCDHIVAVSGDIAARLRQRDGVPAAKITVIRNWAPLMPARCAASVLRRKYGIADGEPLVGVIGRLDRQKGQAILLEAWRELPRGQGVLLLLGEGTLKESLRRQAEHFGIDTEIRFCGLVEDVGSYLEAIDVFVLPSLYEGLPLALLEAMSHGLPVIASDLAGIREAVRDGVEGLLVEPGDAVSLAAALERTLGDPALRRRLGAAARRRYEEEFTPEIVLTAYEKFFAEVATQTLRRPRLS
ncbi:MAG TPA: glycosyltransferase family 4 protein [Thermoanaerobaculia bacterium]|nr:glycosyltransferase family 4 protein [Thermoanaerobaculia bacterium]